MTNWWNIEHVRKSAHRSRALRLIIEEVAAGGLSTHSALGTTLPLFIERLEEREIPYVITAFPGRGYVIEGKPILDVEV